MFLLLLLQTLIGLFLAMVAVLRIAGDFKEIRATVELSQKTWENARYSSCFHCYRLFLCYRLVYHFDKIDCFSLFERPFIPLRIAVLGHNLQETSLINFTNLPSRNRPSFYGFNHRGKAFHPDYVPPAAQKRKITEIPERFLS